MTWVPEKFAVMGKVLKLRDDDDVWDNGWVVINCGGNRLAEELVPDYYDLIKGHRQATGDAIKK